MTPDDTLESFRLKALQSYEVFDTDTGHALERLVQLAARLAGAPMAALSFVDATCERRKAAVGLDLAEIARTDSLPAQVVASRTEVVIADLRTLPHDEAPREWQGWRAYAGVPLMTADGFVLGVLSVMDAAPETSASALLDGLRPLAQAAMAHIELSRCRRDALEPLRDRFRHLADSMPYVVWSATPEGMIDFANQAIVDYAGLRDASRVGEQWVGLLHPDDVEPTLAAWTESVRTGTVFSFEYRLRRADGAYRWHLAKGMPIRDGHGQISKWYGTTIDIHDMKQAHEQIGRLAFYDPLTGLPNRQLLMDRLAHAVTLHARLGRVGAVLLLDLDNFKNINDTLGHDNGDLLLDLVASRLLAGVAERDTVARLGGDEFVVVLEDIGMCKDAGIRHAARVARRILDALNGSYQLDGHERHVTPSVGITLFGLDGASISELIKRADLAMYQAKAAGRNTVCFFDPKIQASALARAELEAELRRGLQRGELLLYYQPQLNSEGAVTGVEGLLRWQSPQRGMVSPGEFIPLAEDTGLILPIGRWVLEQACAQLVELAADPATRSLHVSVNVSALQFRQRDFVADVLTVLSTSGANPRRLTIELTESLLVEDIDSAIDKINLLKKHGVCLSLDDFGTGYSSLTYLKRLPLDQLKIDQSFVHNLPTDRRDLAIVNAIIALGKAMGVAVIAEGVETSEQRDLLMRCGCTSFQGYLYSKPLPGAQLQAFLAQRLSAAAPRPAPP